MDIQDMKNKYMITDLEIAKVLGVSKQSVRIWRWSSNVPSRNDNDLKLANMLKFLEDANIKKWYKHQAYDYLLENYKD